MAHLARKYLDPLRSRQASVHPSTRSPPLLCSYLIKHIRHVLLAAGLLDVAELRGVLARQQALVPDQRHALIRHLVALKVDLVVGTTCKERPSVSIH